MDSAYLTPFERSLVENLLPSVGEEPAPGPERETLLCEVRESCHRLAETIGVRKQIDSFLAEAGSIEEIGALLLTIITVGDFFGYNRALLLLTDPDGEHIRGYAGIGTVSKEETWNLWADILSEGAGLEDLVKRAVINFRAHNERLTPLLERLIVAPGQSDSAAMAFFEQTSKVLDRPGQPDGSEWLFDVLGVERVGTIPLLGYYGHFGVLLVDKFASDLPLSMEGIHVLEGFIKPFVNALEKALIIQRYQEKVAQLQEAKALIEAQQGMLIRMERKSTVGRFTATMAHNLLNPVLSMSGHLVKLAKPETEAVSRNELLQALHQDVRDLEEFLKDFISQMQTEFPLRHFWDLNHLIGEVISSYRCFHTVLPPSIAFDEGDIPLVLLDYERVTGALSRIMGIVSVLLGGLDGLTVTTRKEGSSIHLSLAATAPFSFPAGWTGDRIRDEVRRLREFLADEEIEFEQGPGSFELIFKL